MKRIIFLYTLSLFLIPFLIAQSTQPIERSNTLFEQAKTYFETGDFGACSVILKSISDTELTIVTGEERDFMLATSAYHLKEQDAKKTLTAYLSAYPATRHRNQVEFLIGSLFFFEANYPKAIAAFNRVNVAVLGEDEFEDYAFRMGYSELKTDELERASTWFESLELSSQTYRSEAIYYNAYLAYYKKNYPKALNGFLSLKEEAVFKERTLFYIAQIYLIQQKQEQALAVAIHYLGTYFDPIYTKEMHRIAGESLYQQGFYLKAIAHLKTYLDQTKEAPRNVIYNLAMSYYQTQNDQLAARYFLETTGSNDEMTQNAYLHLGNSYTHLGDKKKALRAFEAASTYDFNAMLKLQALYNYAVCIHETSYSPFNESVTVFERLLNEYPNSTYTEQINSYLVDAYMNTKSYQAALKSIEQIRKPGKKVLEAKQKILFQLGTQSFANSEFMNAIELFSASLLLGNYNPETKAQALYWRGESNYRIKQYTKSLSDWRGYLNTTQKQDLMFQLVHYNLGYLFFKQTEYEQSLLFFQKYVALHPTDKLTLADAYNRMGDCRFQERNFNQAHQNYTQALQLGPELGDYALFQSALIEGLENNQQAKIGTLNRFIERYPKSPYLDQALYEKGRSHVLLGQNEEALICFQQLVTQFKEQPVAKKAANEIALIYNKQGEDQKAIQMYQFVVTTYPGTEEAKLALADLKTIYINKDQVETYTSLVESLPNQGPMETSERDSLTYYAAERLYQQNSVDRAKTSFESYLKNYPTGGFKLNANYYLGMMAHKQKRFNEALSYFRSLVNASTNQFTATALALSAEIHFTKKEYEKALPLYQRLQKITNRADYKMQANMGTLRCNYQLADPVTIIFDAAKVLEGQKLAPQLIAEARYYRAQALLKQDAGALAENDLKLLAKDTRSEYGAEAKFLLAQRYYQTKNYKEAENEVLNYIDTGTPHAYWLARSFIILADVYLATNKPMEAKQYLISLKQNYKADDTIQSMITQRLNKLK